MALLAWPLGCNPRAVNFPGLSVFVTLVLASGKAFSLCRGLAIEATVEAELLYDRVVFQLATRGDDNFSLVATFTEQASAKSIQTGLFRQDVAGVHVLFVSSFEALNEIGNRLALSTK